MGSIILSIKRFFQNKNTVTIFALLLAVAIIYYAYNYRIKKSTEPVNIPYATRELGPRTLITDEMVSIRKVPGGIVTEDVEQNRASIIGQYVLNTAVIPEGSMFFKSTIGSWDELPKSPYENIGNGQTLSSISVNMSTTYGNSIFPGNYIDIYYTTRDPESGKVWIGKFMQSIRVLDVIDRNNQSVFETIGTPRTPDQLIFNLDESEFRLFEKIKGVGGIQLFPVQRNANYSNNPEPTKIVGNEFKKFVEAKAVEDSVIDGGKK